MATTTFTAASLIFVNIWLVAFVSFGVIASSILLYILNAVDVSIGPSLGTAISCATLSFTYLTLQCVNVAHTKQGRWHQSWLSSICIQFPRVLIVLWIIATIVGFTSAIRKPLCRAAAPGQDVTALQADAGCWIFRVLVLLDAIMLVLFFILFCLLEVNGRYVSLALFHFEYTRSSTTSPYRRRNLIASPYGASVETLPYSVTTISGYGRGCMYEKHDFHSKRSLSPSPTYHTFDTAKMMTPLWSGSALSSGGHTRHGSRDDLLCEHPIPIDLTFHGSLPTRRSAVFTADIPYPHPDDTDTKSIYSGAQLQSRPISYLPALPLPARGIPVDLKDAPNPIVTAPMAAKAILDDKSTICPAPHNHEVNMVEPRARFKSSSALPFEFAPGTHSMVDLSSTCSMTDLASAISASEATTRTTHHIYKPSVDTTHRTSTSCVPEHPPPAWCPQSLKTAPLSADPAIRRLTEFHPRSRASAIRASRVSNMGRRRGSLGAFEFGFIESGPPPAVSSTMMSSGIQDATVDLSHLPPTPTPLARKRATTDTFKRDARGSGISTREKDKSGELTANETSTNQPMDNVTIVTPSKPPKNDQMISRGRARNNTSASISTRTTLVRQFSIMPPLTTITRNRRNTSTSTTTSGLGLTFEDITMPADGKERGVGIKKERGRHGRSGNVAVGSGGGSGKKVLERGRWERLPR